MMTTWTPRTGDPELDRLSRTRFQLWLQRGYRRSLGHPCLSGLAVGQCLCAQLGPAAWTRVALWADHLARWIGREGRVLTSQPYDWDMDKEAALLADLAVLELPYTLEPEASWWYPGQTTLIVIGPPRLHLSATAARRRLLSARPAQRLPLAEFLAEPDA
jgi:hypothetical protein